MGSIEKVICFVQERPFLFDVSSAELAWTCTKIWCKKLVQVSWLCVTTITLVFRSACVCKLGHSAVNYFHCILISQFWSIEISRILFWHFPWLCWRDFSLDPWFIQHPRCIGPHVDAMSVCLEPMLQPLPRLIPFFVDPCSLYLSSLSLVYQVASWILQLPIVGLASECVLHPFLWHDLAIVVFFPGSHSLEAFVLFFSVSPRLWLYPSRWYQECLSATCGGLLPVSCSM